MKPILNEPKNNTIFSIQNKLKYYLHKDISIPYPVIHLDDIEIHCIHDDNAQSSLETFIRRLNRMKEYILNNTLCRIIGILSFSELINDHDDINSVISSFLYNSNNIFAGPTKYKTTNMSNNYIIVKEFDNVELLRNSSYIYIFNNQPMLTTIFSEHISM